ELVFISQAGMVQRTSVRGISRYGRASQGVKLMNIRNDDQVSAVALVVESDAPTAATVAEPDEPLPGSEPDEPLPGSEPDEPLPGSEPNEPSDDTPGDNGDGE
ncbi:MAG TPA: DNA gyrase C-terminal beta-propeller domain-containing protein, partial [Solirubrobacteraceae bacterium]|nr:DNA gyrase C-terminal beta-propeller domain-containing protein [Solirubrobacteraceae bacterium]